MILVTGAAGKTGQAIIHKLAQRKTAVRAIVHKESQIQTVQALGIQDVFVGDMRSQAAMNRATQEVETIYHICPNVSPHEIGIGQVMIRAAQFSGIKRFVYHSVFHPHIEAMAHHWQKMRVEEQLFTSGLTYTILQPAPYMQNILAYWPNIIQQGTYALPYALDTRLGYVDLEDVAEVATIVLSEPGHEGAIYELCGVASLSQIETAQILSTYLACTIEVSSISIDVWAANARKNGLGEYQIQTLSKMFHYYDQFGYTGNSKILTTLLNRVPTSFSTFIEKLVGNSPP